MQVQKLNQLYQAQSSFFAGLSHEFRTALTLLLAHLEELSKQEKSVEQVHQYLTQQMQTNAAQLLELVNQLLDAAKLEIDAVVDPLLQA